MERNGQLQEEEGTGRSLHPEDGVKAPGTRVYAPAPTLLLQEGLRAPEQLGEELLCRAELRCQAENRLTPFFTEF